MHVESPDEAGHEGSIRKKIRAIEDFDRLVVGTILSSIEHQALSIRILVLPDHPTPIKVMTHTAEAVPFAIYSTREGARRRKKAIEGYSEKEIKKSKLRIEQGHRLLKLFLEKDGI